jgi:transcriptional regulator GlxA family with amidase domain
MRIEVLVLDHVFDLGLAALLDSFQTANDLIGLYGLDVSPFKVKLVSVRKSIKTAHGFRVNVQPITGRNPDCVIVPAVGFKMPAPLEAALLKPEIKDACAALRQWSRPNIRITSACVGTFVIAESGLLDEHQATTSWWLAPMFRQRYPSVLLDESNMVVTSGKFTTAGAALSHIDLALWLIRGVSPELASLVGKYLIVDSRPSQSAYALTDHLVHSDLLVQRFEGWARANIAEGFCLDEAAEAVGASKRTLARHVQRVLGKSPLAFFQNLRVERAVHLLKTTEATVEEIAERVGYNDATTLRALLRRQLKQGVIQIRRN